jgi:hypothetical protein
MLKFVTFLIFDFNWSVLTLKVDSALIMLYMILILKLTCENLK